jgi:protease-4
MGDLAASGGYYIRFFGRRDLGASRHDHRLDWHLRRHPDVPEHAQKVGVNVDGVGTTNLSGQLRIDRPMGEDAKILLQSFIDAATRNSSAHVGPKAARRPATEVHAIAQGRVWIGTMRRTWVSSTSSACSTRR